MMTEAIPRRTSQKNKANSIAVTVAAAGFALVMPLHFATQFTKKNDHAFEEMRPGRAMEGSPALAAPETVVKDNENKRCANHRGDPKHQRLVHLQLYIINIFHSY